MIRGRRLGRMTAALLAAAVTLTLTAAATPPVEAQVPSPAGTPTRFTDPNRLTIADQPAPGGWLGFAPEGATQAGFFVGQSNRSVAIDSYGYATGLKPSTATIGDMVTLGEYGDLGTIGEIIDIAVGVTVGSDSPSVAILHKAGVAARLEVRGPLDAGMPHITSFEVSADADDAVGVIIVGRRIVTATRDAIRFYDVAQSGVSERTSDTRLVFDDSVLGIAGDEGVTPEAPSTYAIVRGDSFSRCAHLIELTEGSTLSLGPVPSTSVDNRIGCTDRPQETFRRADLTFVRHNDPSGGLVPGQSAPTAAYAAAMTVDSTAAIDPVRSLMFTGSGLQQTSGTPTLPTCENHAAAGAAVVERTPFGSPNSRIATLRAACLSVPDASGTATLTMLFPADEPNGRDTFDSVTVPTRLTAGIVSTPRDIAIGFPCNESDRRRNSADCENFPTAVSAIVIADEATESTMMSHTFRQQAPNLGPGYIADTNLWGARVPLGLELAAVDIDDLRLVVELDPEFEGCRSGTAAPCTPSVRQSSPIPVALLAAPPTVGGANQGGYSPVFGQSTTAGTTATTTESSSFAITLDAAPSLIDIVELGVEATYGNQVDSSSATSLSTTSANGYGGSMDDNVVVYTTTTNWVYTGTVVESSTGTGLGETTEILQPADSVTTTGSWTALQAQFPDQFSPDRGGSLGPGTMYPSIEAAFANEVGNPGSYLTAATGREDDAIDAHCIGSLTGAPPLRPGGVTIELNPLFTEEAELFPADQRSIMTSDWHVVGTGSNTVETASFDIQAGSEYSYMQTRSLDAAYVGKLFGVGGSYAGRHTWGTGQSTQLSTGTRFIGGVGQLPHSSLSDETYFWRMVLCKRDITDAGTPWVLTYQVRGYTGDGVEALNTPDALGPINSAFAVPGEQLEFVGSEIEADYTIDIEAVSAPDARTVTVRRTPVAPGTNHTADIPGGALLPGELYRWRVTATDVVGRTSIGSTGFFRTQGAPDPVAGIDGSAQSRVVGVGDTVTLTDLGDDGGSPLTQRQFVVNGTTVGTGAAADWTPQAAGVYLVEVRSTNIFGTTTAETTVYASPVGRLDRYQLDEDGDLVVDAASGVMANDSGGTSAIVGTSSGRGELDFRPDGSFDYAPVAEQCGDYGFDYTLVDVVTSVDPTPVQIAIVCQNDAPTALASSYSGNEDEPISATSPGVLAGASDPDTILNGAPADDTLRAMLVSAPAGGTVSLDINGSFTYLGDADFCGTDSFDFVAEDASGARSTAQTVSLSVSCVNDAPAAAADVYAAVAGEPLAVDAATGLLANDTDSDTDTLTVASNTDPLSGALIVAPDGSFVFDSNEVGMVSFDYVVSDGLDDTVGRATIDVQAPVDFTDPPPVIPDVIAEPGASGAIVTYPTPVVPGATVVCTPPSGSVFPIGVTEVTCTASVGVRTLAALNAAALTAPQDTELVFTVTVVDTEHPRFASTPTDIVVAEGGVPTSIDFTVPVATDNDPRPMTVACDPRPGFTFPVGSTLVTCTATDASGLTTVAVFSVRVMAMPDLDGELPATGSSSGRTLSIAAALLGLGLLLLVTARRRRHLQVRVR